MGISVDTQTVVPFAVSTKSPSLTHTCNGPQRLLVALVHGMRNSDTAWSVSSVMYGALSLTQQVAIALSGQGRNVRTEIWTLLAPVQGSPQTLQASFSAFAGCVLTALSLTGVHQTTPLGVSGSDSGVKDVFSTPIVTGADGSWLVGGATNRNGTLSWTPGTGVTERYDQSTGTDLTSDQVGMGGNRSCGAAGSYDFAATLSASNRGTLVAIEVRAAPAVAGGPAGARFMVPTFGGRVFNH